MAVLSLNTLLGPYCLDMKRKLTNLTSSVLTEWVMSAGPFLQSNLEALIVTKWAIMPIDGHGNDHYRKYSNHTNDQH